MSASITACDISRKSTDASRLEEKEWIAVYLEALSLTVEDNVSLRFTGLDESNGTVICSDFFAPVSISEQLIAFGKVSSDDRICGSRVVDIEELYFGALKKTRSWQIDEDVLRLKDGGGTTLVRFRGQ